MYRSEQSLPRVVHARSAMAYALVDLLISHRRTNARVAGYHGDGVRIGDGEENLKIQVTVRRPLEFEPSWPSRLRSRRILEYFGSRMNLGTESW